VQSVVGVRPLGAVMSTAREVAACILSSERVQALRDRGIALVWTGHVKLDALRVVTLSDELADPQEKCGADDHPDAKERLRRYYEGEWHFVGVRAEAQVRIDGTLQQIATSGVWGIDSDDAEDIRLHASEQYAELVAILDRDGHRGPDALRASP
jgi:hypothetical protein